MITLANLKKVLLSIGFTPNKSNSLYTKFYSTSCKLEVDFSKEQLIYPSQIIGGTRNTSFKKSNGQPNNENFVVFECVNRLLDKGYRPEHIELEKTWTLGHTQKGGRSDIIVYDSDMSSVLFIIECKTYGNEYQKALTDTNTDGAQVFSYWQQEPSTKWLALYASDFDNTHNNIIYNCPVISCTDDINVISAAASDKNILLYTNAKNKVDRYNVWHDTYKSKWYNDLILSSDTCAYKIGVRPIFKKELLPIDYDTKQLIINQFEEILRHNNISDKENAFNRLIALFICKLVDEMSKTDQDILEFQYKQGTDTYESLQDRLQKLHQIGMQNFMGEKIEYVPNDFAYNFLKTYHGKDRQQAIDSLNETIRTLKFYSNNDFAFKEVHNRELFLQNGKLLVEIVQLFEKYRIVYPAKQIFLGDLFEQLLNKGFKQNEGQFFTPAPITRFIWDSIPLDKIIPNTVSGFPKVIDFACGAGHFLTEGIECIDDFFNNKLQASVNANLWVRDSIFGIEKDYRLARVSKVSMFMNGAGFSNIIFGDGLDNYSSKNITENSFDILVANPPYSVSAFKPHLSLKENSNLQILNHITDAGGSIETLFVERTTQLLKPKGIAAIILPTSLLCNTDCEYVAARDELLKNFHIRAICCMGSQTFGATGKATMILFLEKRDNPPKYYQMMEDTISAIINGKSSLQWGDKALLDNYLKHINVSYTDYQKFIKAKPTDNLTTIFSGAKYFEEYIDENKSEKGHLDFIKENEHKKLFLYSLVYQENVLIIHAPEDTNKQKEFLGYKWEKDNIKPLSGKDITGGLLFDIDNRDANNVLSYVIKQAFNTVQTPPFQTLNGLYKYKDLREMIDFKAIPFSNTIRTEKFMFRSSNPAYRLDSLKTYATVSNGNSAPKSIEAFHLGSLPFFRTKDVGEEQISTNCTITKDKLNSSGASTLTLFRKGTILFPKSGASTYLDNRVIMGCDGYVTSHLATINIINPLILDNEYLFYVLTLVKAKGIKPQTDYPSLNQSDIKDIIIPITDIKRQKAVASCCNLIYNNFKKTKMNKDTFRSEIEKIFNKEGISCGIF